MRVKETRKCLRVRICVNVCACASILLVLSLNKKSLDIIARTVNYEKIMCM